jgi:micrococcal nuclease
MTKAHPGSAGCAFFIELPAAWISAAIFSAAATPRSASSTLTPSAAVTAETPAADCDIKGNISPETGEHIYHLPGQKYYAKTRISPGKGERWFCSEAEARAAGWRRAKV